MNALRVFLLVTAAVLSSPSQAPAQGCESPNAGAKVIRPEVPQIPPMAQQQGISGRVEVVVSLNADSRVVGTKIRSSASAILNPSALAAARNSTYQTRIVDCVPVAADYIFSVVYTQR
jgi:TonB family protein